MSDSVGFLGLGHLGLALATNLLDRGYTLRVHNRTASKAGPLVARGAVRVEAPVDAVTRGGVVVTVLWDDASVEQTASDAFLEELGPGGLHIAMTTVSPEGARRIAARHAAHGCLYLAAPVFGRPEAAAARELVVPISGAASARERGRPIVEALGAQSIHDFGEDAGAAVMVKLAGNFLIGTAARSLAEAVDVAGQQGVDPRALVDMLTTTLLSAPIYRSYGQRLLAGAPPMQGGIIAKDVDLFRRTATQVARPTPLADQLHEVVKG